MTIDALPDTSVLANLVKAATPIERRQWAKMALELVDVDWAPRPVPRAFLDLPRMEETDEDAAWDIAARVLASSDPYAIDAAGKTKLSELVGHRVTVHAVGVRPISPADLETDPTRRIGAYLALEISVDDDQDHTLAFSGSPRVVTPLLYAYAKGDLPIQGTIAEIVPARGKKSAVLAFVVEQPF
jgi:hypothetical protein